MSKDEIRQGYISMLRGMLSPAWQKPSARKIEVLLKRAEDAQASDSASGADPERSSPNNRRRLTALIAAGTKLDAAARFVKEATIDIASSGLFPVEVREDLQKIAADIDTYIQRRITSAIEHIP